MKLENEFTVPVDIDTVFDALNDPEKVTPCFPGATLDSRDGDDFTGTVKVDGGTISEARIGLTNMAGTPVRATAVESALVGQSATEDNVRKAAQAAAEGTSPTADADAGTDYREHLARVLTGRAVLAAAG